MAVGSWRDVVEAAEPADPKGAHEAAGWEQRQRSRREGCEDGALEWAQQRWGRAWRGRGGRGTEGAQERR